MTTTFPNLFNVFPGAGGNWQTIDTRWWSPNISVSFAGDPVIEREVTEDVASYGSQIGWLNDIVIALAAAAPDAIVTNADAKRALDKATKARVEIDRIKRRRKQSAIDKARDALADLGASDTAGYARLVRSLDPNKPLGSE
jgi:hypothetical protein